MLGTHSAIVPRDNRSVRQNQRESAPSADAAVDYLITLITLPARPNIILQVMPFDRPPGYRAPLASPFTLIRPQN